MSVDDARGPLHEVHPDSHIRQAVHEVDAHMTELGWDHPVALFALVERAQLITQSPDLADSVGDTFYVPVAQEDVRQDRALEELLGEITWPETVAGCAVSVERVMLPPEVEDELPTDPDELDAYVAEHPQRSEVRIIAAADRGGATHSAVRAREPQDAPLLESPELVPGLVSALQATLAD